MTIEQEKRWTKRKHETMSMEKLWYLDIDSVITCLVVGYYDGSFGKLSNELGNTWIEVQNGMRTKSSKKCFTLNWWK